MARFIASVVLEVDHTAGPVVTSAKVEAAIRLALEGAIDALPEEKPRPRISYHQIASYTVHVEAAKPTRNRPTRRKRT